MLGDLINEALPTTGKGWLAKVTDAAMQAKHGECRRGAEPRTVGELVDLLNSCGLGIPSDTSTAAQLKTAIRASAQRLKHAACLALAVDIPDLPDGLIGEGDDLDLDDEDEGDDDVPDVIEGNGKINSTELLSQLLSALGITVPPADSDADWKRALMQACMSKVQQLAEMGREGNGERGQQQQQSNNPLIPTSAQQEAQPLYLSTMDRLRAEREHHVMRQHAADVALAMAPPPQLTAEAEARIVADMARRMGCAVEPGKGTALSVEERAAQGFADLVGKFGARR